MCIMSTGERHLHPRCRLRVGRLGFDLPPVAMGAVPHQDRGSPEGRG